MSSPLKEPTNRKNNRHREESQSQSIPNRDSSSPENRPNAERQPRGSPEQQIVVPAALWKRYQYHYRNRARPSWVQKKRRLGGNTSRSRKSKQKATIQSQSLSTAVTDQAPSTSTLPADRNAAEGAVQEQMPVDDENGSQRTSLAQNAANQEVLPSPEQPRPSSTSTRSQLAARSETENPTNEIEDRSGNPNTESTNVKKENVPKIISVVQKFPCVYDKAHLHYRDPTQKAIAWADISKAMGVPVEDCQKQWTRQYRKYCRIMDEPRCKNFEKFPGFMAAMNFLSPRKKRRSRTNTIGEVQAHQAVFQSIPHSDLQFCQTVAMLLQQCSTEEQKKKAKDNILLSAVNGVIGLPLSISDNSG